MLSSFFVCCRGGLSPFELVNGFLAMRQFTNRYQGRMCKILPLHQVINLSAEYSFSKNAIDIVLLVVIVRVGSFIERKLS